MHTEPIYAARALGMGARAYVSKSAPAGELMTGVRRVLEGSRYVEREIEEELAQARSSKEDPLAAPDAIAKSRSCGFSARARA